MDSPNQDDDSRAGSRIGSGAGGDDSVHDRSVDDSAVVNRAGDSASTGDDPPPSEHELELKARAAKLRVDVVKAREVLLAAAASETRLVRELEDVEASLAAMAEGRDAASTLGTKATIDGQFERRLAIRWGLRGAGLTAVLAIVFFIVWSSRRPSDKDDLVGRHPPPLIPTDPSSMATATVPPPRDPNDPNATGVSSTAVVASASGATSAGSFLPIGDQAAPSPTVAPTSASAGSSVAANASASASGEAKPVNIHASASGDCASPYTIDPVTGHKQYRRGCLGTTTDRAAPPPAPTAAVTPRRGSSDCSPPFTIDAHNIRHYKLSCL